MSNLICQLLQVREQKGIVSATVSHFTTMSSLTETYSVGCQGDGAEWHQRRKGATKIRKSALSGYNIKFNDKYHKFKTFILKLTY